MATPIMTGNVAMQEYLARQYRIQRYLRAAGMPGAPTSKREAHAIAFQAMLAARRKAMYG